MDRPHLIFTNAAKSPSPWPRVNKARRADDMVASLPALFTLGHGDAHTLCYGSRVQWAKAC